MDTSEQYIKMCEKALPDIGCHGWLDGDFAYRNGKVEVFHQKAAANMGWQTGDQCIPLYHQDQLQEMVNKEYVTIDAMFQDFVDWGIANDDYLEDIFAGNETAEQLWLAFVMKERFRKVWDGEKWILSSPQTDHTIHE